MKKYHFILFAVIVFSLISISATKNGSKDISKQAPKNFAFIPAGINKNVATGIITTINAFFLQKTEVTNSQYQEFLTDLKKSGRTADYEIASVKSDKWKDFYLTGIESYSTLKDYPVVNISREGANLYCKWLENKLNADNKKNYIYEVRLPTSVEWEYAARGGIEYSPFPWHGPYTRNSKGCYLAQYKAFGLKIGPVPVTSFFPNLYGLYCMAGNVAEMVSDAEITRGGSWNSSEPYIQVESTEYYTVWPTIGFRPALTINSK